MIKSPCVNTCKLDSRQICQGCKRTIEEITHWSKLTNDEKLKIIMELKFR